MLLMLDNFDQLLPAAPLLSDLLTHCPGLTLLVTSRAVLYLHGEQEFVVPPLPVPPLVHRSGTQGPGAAKRDEPLDPSSVTRYPAVELFVQRARHVHAGRETHIYLWHFDNQSYVPHDQRVDALGDGGLPWRRAPRR